MGVLESDIEYFSEWLAGAIDVVDSLNARGRQDVRRRYLQQVAYCGILDTLSKCRYPDEARNRVRFTEFVTNYCNWENAQQISLIHLNQLLSMNSDESLRDLRRICGNRLKTWSPHGGPIFPDRDPQEGELNQYWPIGEPVVFQGRKFYLSHFRLANLFWSHRNQLVHEFRSEGFDVYGGDRPYYHAVTHDLKSGGYSDVWQLVFPVAFHHRLAMAGLECLVEYLRDESINPYGSFDPGTFLIPELNHDFP